MAHAPYVQDLMEALEDCIAELEALQKARDSDYARPDLETIERAKAILKKAEDL